ncbi:MAG: UDP-N-acetylmuramate--L-alanine ligase [Bacteroidetes bacterium]|nr:UDP-N-acetylmuramate--L-alanine ligase [Bacteroidota bacterium]
MDLNNIRFVYFLGIGGIGMSALARYFNTMGVHVYGYDKTPTPLTAQLTSENISIGYEDTIESLPDFLQSESPEHILVVYTPAIPIDSKQYNFLKLNHTLYKRSQVLGIITRNFKTVAVAGTHGKTTTSSLVTHLLMTKGLKPSAFLGGISKNLGSNFIAGNTQSSDSIVVVEADEFDRSFLTLHPYLAIITSTDADHLDIYGNANALLESYQQFAKQVVPGGKLIYKKGLDLGADGLSYSITEKADCNGNNIRIQNNQYVFDYQWGDVLIRDITTGLPGRHNVENAVAAITIALLLGAGVDEIKYGVSSFKGIKRRFDIQVNTNGITYIDDYAHHPEEISAFLNSVKEMFTGKKITVVFQPHLYTRTRDFAMGFASSLSIADTTYLLPLYPARELPIVGVSSSLIGDMMTNRVRYCHMSELIDHLKDEPIEVLLTIGAGDIDTW